MEAKGEHGWKEEQKQSHGCGPRCSGWRQETCGSHAAVPGYLMELGREITLTTFNRKSEKQVQD